MERQRLHLRPAWLPTETRTSADRFFITAVKLYWLIPCVVIFLTILALLGVIGDHRWRRQARKNKVRADDADV